MAAKQVDSDWMWHPHFTEDRSDTAGLFVHFRKTLVVEGLPTTPLKIQISADTRYKLYVNSQLIGIGPVKGDRSLWFFDELDLAPYLSVGENKIAVYVLRFFHATRHASSFPRLPVGGLMIRPLECEEPWTTHLQSSSSWETAINSSTILPTDLPEDDFLHVYEDHNATGPQHLEWVSAQVHEFQDSTGLGAPWKLSQRMIPPMRFQSIAFNALHNIKSPLPCTAWEEILLKNQDGTACHKDLRLKAQTSHYLELEVENHTTAFLRFRFKRPKKGGSALTITYAESYEDPPRLVPYLRSKGDRRDDMKALYGPRDKYTFRGAEDITKLGHYENEDTEEIFMPFHFRTFRFIGLRINVVATDLVLQDIEITTVAYPLDVCASFEVAKCKDHSTVEQLWTTSVRTLANCMHDCYEDCPFYEQLQYAMDMRSSALFTYYVSGDDRLARQAMIQIHNSFESRLGLTSSRAPCHQPQIIPHFSLYWICAIGDHFTFFGDKAFVRQFVSVIDGVLEFFNSHIDSKLQLISARSPKGMWNFTDWTDEWRPYGIPPAAEKTGFSTYTNNLYVYTLKNAAITLQALGRSPLADEYLSRANEVIEALRLHCFDGSFFTDGLAKMADPEKDYSQHNQVWAVLSGTVTGPAAQKLIRQCFDPLAASKFTQPSLSMSFYTLRALCLVDGDLYNQQFHAFWEPWRKQLALNLTTWEEDSVSQRSDCHAWGSSPIYEFMAEVAGVYPAKPGWEAIRFRPRLGLYPELNAKVPIGGGKGGRPDIAHVKWFTEDNGDVNVTFRLETKSDSYVPVYVDLPYQSLKMVSGVKELSFVVSLRNGLSVVNGH